MTIQETERAKLRKLRDEFAGKVTEKGWFAIRLRKMPPPQQAKPRDAGCGLCKLQPHAEMALRAAHSHMPEIQTKGKKMTATGTEARVCELIAARQAMGRKKYGTPVAENPLALREWLQHAIEESLDFSIYLMRSLEELDKQEGKK